MRLCAATWSCKQSERVESIDAPLSKDLLCVSPIGSRANMVRSADGSSFGVALSIATSCPFIQCFTAMTCVRTDKRVGKRAGDGGSITDLQSRNRLESYNIHKATFHVLRNVEST